MRTWQINMIVNRASNLIFSKKSVVEIISTFLIVLYLYTGISKLITFVVFKEQLYDSPVLNNFASLISWLLPTSEFIISFLLFYPHFRIWGLYSSLVMMSIFTIYVSAILFIDETLPCSCGGILSELSWPGHLIFNFLCVLINVLAIRMERSLKFTKVH